MQQRITDPNITVAAIQRLAAGLLTGNGQGMAETGTPDFWKEVSLRAAVEGLPATEERWDTVIIDEGQDFSEGDWILVTECTGQTGRLWVFADDGQAFWDGRGVSPDILQNSSRFRLKKNYRCLPPIQNLVDCYAGRSEPDWELLKSGTKEKILGIVTSSSPVRQSS